MSSSREKDAVQAWEDLDVGKIVVRTATSVVKNRPVTVSVWVLGLLLAAFAKGFSVDDVTRDAYLLTLGQAQEVEAKELNRALRELHKAEQIYNNAKGWFWSCDAKCQKAWDKVTMAQSQVARAKSLRDQVIQDARREVGIWSTFGVQDVRNSFWAAWQSGKDFASRYTFYDAIFMMMGREEETLMTMVLKIIMQYIMNLTVGLIGAFIYFVYNVYSLIVAYGEPALSGVAFFLLVLVAGLSTVGTFLFAIYGSVAGGGLFLIKQAAKQAAVEGRGGAGPRPRPVQYGGTYGSGQVGGQRMHFD